MHKTTRPRVTGPRLLLEAFSTKFQLPRVACVDFIRLLGQVKMPFADFFAQLRRIDYPGYPTFECGLPSCYYYYIPGSGWGSERPFPPDPIDRNFVYSTDGIGLNLGCPFRLKRALEILTALSVEERKECEVNLALPAKHLATIEELLWLDIWNPPYKASRSEDLPGKRHDWKVEVSGHRIRQECKLRPSDWARQVDGVAFTPVDSGFLIGKASQQLPNPPEPDEINVASIIGVAGIDSILRNAIAQQLATFSNVDVLIYRNFVNEMAVFGRREEVAATVHRLIAPQEAIPFQPMYVIVYHLNEGARRTTAAGQRPKALIGAQPPSMFEKGVQPLPPTKTYFAPPLPYRSILVDRLPSGEPVFEVVAPYKFA